MTFLEEHTATSMVTAARIKNFNTYYFLLSIAFIFAMFLLVSSFTFAEDSTKPSEKPVKEIRQELVQEKKDLRIAKLSSAKLNVCKNKEKTITNRLESLTKLVATQETSFDRIAARVENFYTTKVVPSSKTVSNYDSLVADIAAKKAAVDTSLTTAKTNASSFSCTADNPKGALTQFNTDMQNVKKALNNYRTSIRNLIVAIKPVVGEESPSPTPTSTP